VNDKKYIGGVVEYTTQNIINFFKAELGYPLEEEFFRGIYYVGMARFIGLLFGYYNHSDSIGDRREYDNKIEIGLDFEQIRDYLSNKDDYIERASIICREVSRNNIEHLGLNCTLSVSRDECNHSIRLTHKILNWLTEKHSKKILLGCYFPRKKYAFLAVKSFFLVLPYKLQRYSIDNSTTIDYEKRHKLKKCLKTKSRDGFEDFLSHAISELLPVMYLECFESAYQYYNSSIKKFTRLNEVFSESWFSDSQISFFNSVARKRGIEFNIIEHNGPTIYFEETTLKYSLRICDNLFTQGWSPLVRSLGYNNIVQSSSFHMGFKQSANNIACVRDDNITFFTAPAYKRRALCSDMYFFQGEGSSKFIEKQIDFISSVKASVRRKIIYRTAPISTEKNFLIDSCVNEMRDLGVKIDDLSIRNGVDVLKKTSLAIYDYVSTGIFEAYLSDTPTIVIADRGTIRFSEQYKSIIDELYEANLFFDSVIDASNLLNNEHFTPSEWWNEESRNKLALRFAGLFVSTNDILEKHLLDATARNKAPS
jgi:putative transferase (TIGR04331 family)